MLDPIAIGGLSTVALVALFVLIQTAKEKTKLKKITKSYKHCIICDEADEDVQHTVSHAGEAYVYTYYYHMACVIDAVCNPEKHVHHQVHNALNIIEARKKFREHEKEVALKKIQRKLVQKSKCREACKRIRSGEVI